MGQAQLGVVVLGIRGQGSLVGDGSGGEVTAFDRVEGLLVQGRDGRLLVLREVIEGDPAGDLEDAAGVLREAFDATPAGRFDRMPDQLSDALIGVRDAARACLSGFPRELDNSDEWRFALVSLESEEARCGYGAQFGPASGTLPSSYGCYAIPAGLYAACFWKGPAGRGSSDEPLPEQTVPHEAYRWTVTVKAGETTTIDLSREW